MKKIFLAVLLSLCAVSGLYGQNFHYDKVGHVKLSVGYRSDINDVTVDVLKEFLGNNDTRFYITAGGLNAMMELAEVSNSYIYFSPDRKDPNFCGNCTSITAVKAAREEILAQLKEIFARPEYQPAIAWLFNVYDKKIPLVSLTFVEKFNPKFWEKESYEMCFCSKEVFPGWETLDMCAVLDDHMKKCSASRVKGLGYGEYLGYDDEYITMQYDYSNSDYASVEEAKIGILNEVGDRIAGFKGSKLNSLEHIAMTTRREIRPDKGGFAPVKYSFSKQELYDLLKDKYEK